MKKLPVSGIWMAFLALEIYTLGKQTIRIKKYNSCCIFVSLADKRLLNRSCSMVPDNTLKVLYFRVPRYGGHKCTSFTAVVYYWK